MTWQLFLLASILINTASTLAQRLFLSQQKDDEMAYVIFFQVVLAVVVALIGYFSGQLVLPSDLGATWVNLGLAMIFGALAYAFIIGGLKRTNASIFTIIFSTRALFSVAVATFLLGEGLRITEIVGGMIIFCGVFIALFERKGLRFGKGEVISLLAAVAVGLATVNDRIALSAYSVPTYMALAGIGSAILLSLVKPKSVFLIAPYLQPKKFLLVVILALLQALGLIAFLVALQIGPNASTIVTLNLVGVITIVIAAAIFLKERNQLLRKLLGAVLSVGGLALLMQP